MYDTSNETYVNYVAVYANPSNIQQVVYLNVHGYAPYS